MSTPSPSRSASFVSTSSPTSAKRKEVPSSPRKKTVKNSNLTLTVRSFSTLERISVSESNCTSSQNQRIQTLANNVLRKIQHENICPVADLLTANTNTHFLVSTRYKTTISDEITYCRTQNKKVNDERIYKVASQIFSACNELHKYSIYVGFLIPQCLSLDNLGNVKLADYGYFYLLNELNIHPKIHQFVPYLAPELFQAARYDLTSSDSWLPSSLLCSQSDSWTIGVIMMEYILGSKVPFTVPNWNSLPTSSAQSKRQKKEEEAEFEYQLSLVYKQIYEFVDFCWSKLEETETVTPEPVDFQQAWERLARLDKGLVVIILLCLSVDVTERPSLDWIVEHEDFLKISKEKQPPTSIKYVEVSHLKSLKETTAVIPSVTSLVSNATAPVTAKSKSRVDEESLMENYVQWKDFHARRNIDITAFLGARKELRLPISLMRSSYLFSASVVPPQPTSDLFLFSTMTEFLDRMFIIHSNILKDWCTKNNIQPPAVQQSAVPNGHTLNDKYSSLSSITGDLMGSKRFSLYPRSSFSNLLSDKDQDPEYQQSIVAKFRRLLLEYPNSRLEIIKEVSSLMAVSYTPEVVTPVSASTPTSSTFSPPTPSSSSTSFMIARGAGFTNAAAGIPSVLRGEIWACILGVEDDVAALELYESIDKESKTTSDRQISVDVPRCHQYNKLLSSPEGHQKLTNILKAWVRYQQNTQSDLVYWQGLDSLCAPFLVLSFHFEARAFVCLKAIVNKFVKQFFVSDNSFAMEERLVIFQKLVMYHIPELANHLLKINFPPELYSIPWFLTLFAHVLPIEKIFKLWDCMLLHNSPYLPLFIGLAFMKQIHQNLLHADFNTAVTLLTNMQGIDIRRAVEDIETLKEKTPACLLNPSGTPPPSAKTPIPATAAAAISPHSFLAPNPLIARQSGKLTLSDYKEACLCPRVSAEDFTYQLLDLAILLDIRDEASFKACHLRSAHHVGPSQSLMNATQSSSSASEKIVVVMKHEKVSSVNDEETLIYSYFDEQNPNLSTPTSGSITQTTSISSAQEEKMYKQVEENITNFIQYKKGLPIVLISYGEEDERDHNILARVERLLVITENTPYVSVLHGGMKGLKKLKGIPLVHQ